MNEFGLATANSIGGVITGTPNRMYYNGNCERQGNTAWEKFCHEILRTQHPTTKLRHDY